VELGLGGRIALVMGASQGLGKAIAAALAREGARVALTSRSRENIVAAADEIGDAAKGFVADTTDAHAIERLPGEVTRAMGGAVEILVLNTGGPPRGGPLDQGPEEWERAWRSLVLAPRLLAGAVVPAMRKAGWGRIVNVGSSTTFEPIPTLNLSNANRMATVGFLKSLAWEVAADGVTVNTVATGRFDTERLRSLGMSEERLAAQVRKEVPVGRLGRPEEYGDLVAFLCSERAAYLTGTVIPLDGGMLRSV
jgi:3-oxoacyl-[acyl-carrier protein] reductase